MSLFSWYRDTKKTTSNSNSTQQGYSNNLTNAKADKNTSMWPIAKAPLNIDHNIISNKKIPTDHALITIHQVNKNY